MKNIILLLVLFLSVVPVFSQVTLTGAYAPSIGDVQQDIMCDTIGIMQGPSGANRTWSFPSLTSRGSEIFNWVNPASTPFVIQFPNANVASSTDNTNFTFYTTSSANFIVDGYGGPQAVIQYYDQELFFHYPFTYGSNFTDTFASDFLEAGIPMHRTGSINVIGDAWGTITLPDVTFNNALRVYYIQVHKDSATTGTQMVLVQTFTSYNWFAPGKKFPVLEITYVHSVYNNSLIIDYKLVNYNPTNVPVGIKTISSQIPGEFKLYQNYPNPFNPTTKIKFDITESKQVNLIVYNLTGKEIAKLFNGILKAGSYEYEFNAGSLTSGVYFYKLSEGDFTQTRKMILLK